MNVYPAGPDRALIDTRRAEATALLDTSAAREALGRHGTPLLLLEPERVRAQFRRLQTALPFVHFHYAVKALAHDAVIAALADEGCGFDVASREELALLRRHAVAPARVIHTHPIKKPSEIAEARGLGVRTFVVDNETELDKFAGSDVRLLIRLAYRSPHAKSDLSSKFGACPFVAEQLVVRAAERGIRVAGFSFHVGSQLDDPQRFVDAIRDTLALMDRLRATHGARFDTLDIGGGFAVAYDAPVAPLEELAAAIRPVLEPRAGELEILAEPGRVLVAEAMTLVTSVVGIAERADGRWYYLDDGVYGSYSNVIAEDAHPLVFAAHADGTDAARWATLAGPTCDSADVIAREVLLPDLVPGDLLVSPAMGAYTTVTATTFNGRAVTPVTVVEAATARVESTAGAVEVSVPAQESRPDAPHRVPVAA